MDKNPRKLGEFDLIERYFARSGRSGVADSGVILGIGDDAAVLRVPDGRELLAAVDTIVAGRHFLAAADPRAIGFVQKLIKDDMLHGDHISRLKLMHIHMIGAEAHMKEFGASSKMNSDPEFLGYLKQLGRSQADKWLETTFDQVGKRTSIDIKDYL